MNAKRPNQQQELPFTQNGTGEAQSILRQGVEASTSSSGTKSPAADAAKMMEAICSSRNLSEAIRRVIANKGAPGVDGMTVHELEAHFKRHGSQIVSQLLSGTYQPAPVQRVEIPKPDGGVRKLGMESLTSLTISIS